jgi:hypothetical protein
MEEDLRSRVHGLDPGRHTALCKEQVEYVVQKPTDAIYLYVIQERLFT